MIKLKDLLSEAVNSSLVKKMEKAVLKGKDVVVYDKKGKKYSMQSAFDGGKGVAVTDYLGSERTWQELPLSKVKKIVIEGKLTSEQLSEGFDLKKLEIVIKSIQKKIAKQGRVTNARDEDHLKQLIKVYKQMGGKKIKEQMNESKLRGMIREIIKEQLNEQKLMKILLNKKDMSKLQKVMKKYPFKSLPKFKQKGSDIELNVPKKEYNKAVEFLMKNKLNPRG